MQEYIQIKSAKAQQCYQFNMAHKQYFLGASSLNLHVSSAIF